MSASVVFLLASLLLARARAEEPADTRADEAHEETDLPLLSLGPVQEITTLRPVEPRALRLSTCAEALPPPPREPAYARSGEIILQLQIRRGRVRLVTVTEVEPGLEPLTPCLERELARVEWGLQRGELRVPVRVESPRPPADEED